MPDERDQFAEVLEELAKVEDERVEAVLFLASPEAVRLAASWRRLKKGRAETCNPAPVEEADRWSWLWAQVYFSVEDWARLADVPVPAARRLAQVLIDNRIVYPDGTLNLFAGKYVQRRALKVGLVESR